MATLTSFRAAFPEFVRASAFPDAQVTYWMEVSARLVNADRWGTITDHGIYLLTAHWLALAAQNMAKPGTAGMGSVSSKAIDKVSVSYDVAMGSVEGAGAYNSTSYGRQFAHLARMYGAGGMQL